MINKTFKAHPLTIIRLMKPYLFVLVIPLVRAVIQYFTKGEINGLLALELIAFALVLTIAILGWRSIKISVKNQCIAVQKGVVIRSCAVIDVSRISSVSLKQNIIDFLFGSVDCAINTEAGTPKKSDFRIKMHLCDARSLYHTVYGSEKMENEKFSPWRIALLAATTSSAATGIIVGVPVIYQTSDLLGIAISDMLLNEIHNVSAKFNNIFPPIVNTITIILFVAYGVSFLISFLKNVNFKLKSGKKSIEIRSGLIVRKKITFKKAMVNNICFEQPPLLRLMKRYLMRVSIGGYGDDKGEKAVVVPVARHIRLEESLKEQFPFWCTVGTSISPMKTKESLARFMLLPTVLAMVVIALCATAIFTFPYFDRLILFVMIVFLCLDAYYASVCIRNYRLGSLRLGESVLVVGSKGLTVRELYCDKNRLGIIKISRAPIDRFLGTCKVKLVVRGEGADSVKIKNLSAQTTAKEINKNFNINIDV